MSLGQALAPLFCEARSFDTIEQVFYVERGVVGAWLALASNCGGFFLGRELRMRKHSSTVSANDMESPRFALESR